jgi:type II secretory pathway pseudopilin PulG
VPALNFAPERAARGFALVELLVAAVLLAPLALMATALVVHTLRGAARATLLADQEARMDHAALVLEAELGPLASGDGLLAITPARVRFRATRAAGRWCQRDTAGFIVPTPAGTWAASRMPVAGRDSVVLELPDSSVATGYRRVRLALVAAPTPIACPGGVAGQRVAVGVLPASPAPSELFQTEEVVELAAYVSGGQTWLGLLHLGLGTPIEPVAGPFAPGGVRFDALDPTGTPTLIPAVASLILIRLVLPGSPPKVRVVQVPLRG